MRRFLSFLISMLLFHSPIFADGDYFAYKGKLHKYPIELVFEDGEYPIGMYMYSKHDTGITLDGEKKGKKTLLFERDTKGKVTGTFVFENLKTNSKKLNGHWINSKNKKKLKVSLTKQFEVLSSQKADLSKVQFPQNDSMKKKYFRLQMVWDEKMDYQPSFNKILVYEKKTDKLLQEIPFQGEKFFGSYQVSVGDYNFDGIEDFSLFMYTDASSNEIRRYFFYDTQKNQFVLNKFKGINLEFNSKTKMVKSVSTCCHGTRKVEETYKIKNNEFVLIGEKCMIYNDNKGRMEKRNPKECK